MDTSGLEPHPDEPHHREAAEVVKESEIPPPPHHDTQLQEETDLQLDGLRLHTAVATHDRRMPCLTTPAPSDDGRPAPKKLRGKIDPEQKARWLQDGRSFAPWQYSPEALLHAADGSMTVPPPEAKEQLHQLPRWYTAVPGVSERARHRMLANGWHIGSAKFIMMLVFTVHAHDCSGHSSSTTQTHSDADHAEHPATAGTTDRPRAMAE